MTKQLENTIHISVQGNVIDFSVDQIEDSNEQLRQAQLAVKKIKEIFNKSPNTTFNMLTDLNNTTSISLKARGVYADFAHNKQIDKIALVGGNLKIKVLSKFIISAAGREEIMEYFDTKEEALEWFRSNGSKS